MPPLFPTDDEIRHLAAMLVSPPAAPTPVPADTLRALEAVLVSDDCFRVLFQALDRLRPPADPDADPPLIDADRELPAVAERGLGALPPERFYLLAASSVALFDLRGELFNYLPPGERDKPGSSLRRALPAYWVETAMLPYEQDRVAAITAAAKELLRTSIGTNTPSEVAMERARPREPACGLLHFGPGGLAGPRPDREWRVPAQLTPGDFHAVRDKEMVGWATKQSFEVACGWFEIDRRLEVRFVGGFLSVGAADSTAAARLLPPLPDAPAVDGTLTPDRTLRFAPLPPEWGPEAGVLAVRYSCAEFDAELIVPLGGD